MLAIIQKKYATYFLRPYLQWYLQKVRTYSYEQFRLKIYPGVFHPHYFFSTSVLIDFVKTLALQNKSFCEVGAGSGIISFIAYEQKAKVVCLDLNEQAVIGIKENLTANFKETSSFNVYHSDLFDAIPQQSFDFIMINPPYFFKEIADDASLAWNCGADGAYFYKLFKQLFAFSTSTTATYMILADNCNIKRIQGIATQCNVELKKVFEKKVKWEVNYIYQLYLHT